jgi:hypothetical protein
MPENHDNANETATAGTANVEFTEAAVPVAEPAAPARWPAGPRPRCASRPRPQPPLPPSRKKKA